MTGAELTGAGSELTGAGAELTGARRRDGLSGVAVVALVAAGAGEVVLSWWMAHHTLLGRRWQFLVPLAPWVVLWVLAASAARRIGRRRLAVGLVIGLAAATRLVAVTGSVPSISNDIDRYGWDAHVQLSGIDPYRYPPDAPQLRSLRQPTWFPDSAGCARIGDRPGCTTINRPNVRTIYPAVAEAWFDAVGLAHPGPDGPRTWQVAGGLVDMATIVALMLALIGMARDPLEAAWYALCPLPVIEFAANGHVDGLALLLLVAAILALQRDRRVLAGVLIGMATMVKIYPAVAGVAAWRKGRWAMALAAVATCLVTELPHVLVVGRRIVGYLPGYIKEEHYSSGGRFLILGVLPFPGRVLTALAVAVVLATVVLVLRRGPEPAVGTAWLLAAVVLVSTPVQPWYAVTLGGMGILAGAPELMLPALAGEPYYAVVILADRHQVAVGRLAYFLALAGVAAGVWRRRSLRRSAPRSAPADPIPTP